MGMYLPPFDPGREFEARNFFRAGGKVWARKQPFDKSCVNERVLRQLYEGRQIAYLPQIDVELLAAERDAREYAATVKPAAASAVAEVPLPQLDHDGDGEPGGSLPGEGGSDEDRAQRMIARYNKPALLERAKGLSLPENPTKHDIAVALVAAGRGDA